MSTPYEKTGEISCSENLTGCGQSIREVTRMTNKGGVPMFLSTPWGVDVSGFRLAVVGALR
ncbi:hypothetical protein ABG886_03980, partial [Bifidobacterium longum]